MTKNFDCIIDYTLVSEYELESLKKALIIPIKKDGVYLTCLVCKQSNLNDLELNFLVKEINISKNEILFFLDDIETRTKIFKLSNLCLKSSDLNSKYIKEFITILVSKAIELRCSDIHIESFEKSVHIRFRIDGKLKLFYVLKKEFLKVISSYIKMLSKLDITQNRLPLDGAFSLSIDKKKYDFRVSTMPIVFGESIVLRVLDSKKVNKDLKSLGFCSHTFKEIENLSKLNQGLVLISGPTGSGKSTTLYSIIKTLDNKSKKIITIEDPVEYKIEQIQQVDIKEEIGLSFDKVLKNILRQDPDIILIGEIRDSFSLQIALQASLTGHLVFASVHANDSIETLFRLIDLKADKYLLATTLKYIISQRLVLNLCKECKGEGCKCCNYTSFYGRSCISEVLKIDSVLSSYILQNSSINEINKYLKTIDFKTMFDDGKAKVKENITTMQELYRVL